MNRHDLLLRAHQLLETQPPPESDTIGRATAALALVALARELREGEVPHHWEVCPCRWSDDSGPIEEAPDGFEAMGPWEPWTEDDTYIVWRRPLRASEVTP